MYLDSDGVDSVPVFTEKDSSSSVVKKVKLGCRSSPSVLAVAVVTACGRADGLTPPTIPRLAMTPTSNPTMKPLTCDPLNSGVSEAPCFFRGLLRLVALPVVGRLRFVFEGAVATICVPVLHCLRR